MDTSPLQEGLAVPITLVADELELIAERVPLDGRRVLELGCGRAEKTRRLAEMGSPREVVALEVDEVQHRLNLAIDDLPRVRFALGGAERIPAADDAFDAVFLFKSLHHVPAASLDRAMAEIARVLRPGGLAWVSEPLYRGAFNEVLRIFHDEREVRRAAFRAVARAVQRGALESVEQLFFRAPVTFTGWDEFARLVIGATHTRHDLDGETLARVRATFASQAAADGSVRFEQPIRVDLLRRPRPAPTPTRTCR